MKIDSPEQTQKKRLMICSGHVNKLLAGVKSSDLGRKRKGRAVADTFKEYMSIDEGDNKTRKGA